MSRIAAVINKTKLLSNNDDNTNNNNNNSIYSFNFFTTAERRGLKKKITLLRGHKRHGQKTEITQRT
jgi:hypothetical protein